MSRLWYEKLRSPLVLQSNLNRWYDGTVNLQGAELDFLNRKARSVHAFRHPSQSALPDSIFKISTPSSRRHVLVGDNLIWLNQDHRQVHVLKLSSWRSKIITGTARELVYDIHASDEIVAIAMRNGTVYVAELDCQGPLKRFRTLNTSIQWALNCRKRTVACAGYLKDGILVYVWDFDTQLGRSFEISYTSPIFVDAPLDFEKPFRPSIGLLLQPETKTVVLCMFNNGGYSKLPNVWYYRFTYTGECLHSAGQLLDGCNCNREIATMTLRFVPASHDGLFMLQANVWNLALDNTLRTLQFDERLYTFTSPGYAGLDSLNPHQRHHFVWWKDTLIAVGSKKRVVVHRASFSHPCHDPGMIYYHSEPIPAQYMKPSDTKDLLINDKYIVRMFDDAFYVYCYDHTVRLPGKNGVLAEVGLWEVVEVGFASMGNSE